ncbi:MAG: T9SS type A sorting domain-containing protein [Bacteroidetes bacterium]|nr:T9SS type A sorting domain-containing protein [Bacteroidota bacterium]
MYDTDTTLYDVLSQNMKDARPAHLAVVDPQWSSGHNLVVDGYNTDDYYHLNFGWGGAYNGWYLIPEGLPYNLTVMEGVIVNIAYPPTSVPSVSARTVSSMKVYPSCFRDNLTIELEIPLPAGASLEVINSSGIVIKTLQVPSSTNGKNIVLYNGHDENGALLSQGIYFVRLKGVEGISPVKCIRIE